MAETRPAKDLKPTGARAKFLIEGKQRQLRKSAQEMRKKAKAQAKDKQPRPAKDIQKGSAREKILKDSRAGKIKAKPPVVTGSSASSLVRTGAARLIGAIGAIVDPSFMSAKTGGAAEAPAPKKGERLMRGMPQVGYGSKTSSADYGYKPKRKGGGPERRQGSSSPSMGMKRDDSYFSDIPSYKSTTQKTAVVTKPKVKPKVKPKAETGKGAEKKVKFKGNWVGAAPTEMQARGGARIKRPNLLSWMKNRRKK